MKTNSKIAYLNPMVSLIILNVNGLKTLIKKQRFFRLDKKLRPKYMLPTMNTLNSFKKTQG